MKKLAILPAFLMLLGSMSSCDKTQVAPESSSSSEVSASLNSLTQGKTVTSTNTGTYPYQEMVNNEMVNRTGTFTSALRITSFEVVNGTIVANGTLSATPTSGPASAYGPVTMQIPLSLSQLSSACSGARVDYGSMNVMMNNTAIAVNPVLTVTPDMSSKNLLGNLLCSLGRILGNPSSRDMGGVVSHLNKIISQIGS